MRRHTLSISLLLLAASLPLRAAGAPPREIVFRLQHLKAGEVTSILARSKPQERLPALLGKLSTGVPVAVQAGAKSGDSSPTASDTLTICGRFDAILEIEHALRVIDVPREPQADGNVRMVLRPQSFRPDRFAALLPKDARPAQVTALDGTLTLVGRPTRIRNALWHVVKLELPNPTLPPGSKGILLTRSAFHPRHSTAGLLIGLFFDLGFGISGEFTPDTKCRDVVFPPGITSVGNNRMSGEIVLRGEERAVRQLELALRVVDVASEKRPEGRIRAVVRPAHFRAEQFHNLLSGLEEQGTVTPRGPALVVEGEPDWVRRALHYILMCELPAVPTANPRAPGPAARLVTAKLSLTNLDPNSAVRMLLNSPPQSSPSLPGLQATGADPGAIPEDIVGILGYPLDRSLLVRGPLASIQVLHDVLRVIDVPVELLDDGSARAVVHPRAFKPEQFRSLLPATVGEGRVTARGRDLILEGAEAWILQALGFVAKLEVGPRSAPK